MLKTVKVRIPGTTANCGPGFDSVGIACTIYNSLELSVSEASGLTIEVSGEGAGAIPHSEKNIVWQAARVVFTQVGFVYGGIRIRMDNAIPLARGLGSSAAAIVGGLVAANAISGNQLTRQQLFELATEMEGHPDNVAPALFGGITLSTVAAGSEGSSQAHHLRFLPPAPLSMIVAVPDFTLSTRASRQVLPQTVSLQDAVFNVSRTAILIGALCKGEFQHLQYALEDKLHQPYRQKLVPGMPEVFQAALANGALGAAISGAGPCLIAFAVSRETAIGDAMVAAFGRHQIKAGYHVLSIDPDGAKIIN